MSYDSERYGGGAGVMERPDAPALVAEVFGRSEWVNELEQFNVRYVVQLGELLASFQGREALRRLQHPVPVDEIQDQTNHVLEQRESVSLGDPRSASATTGLALRARHVYGLGVKLPPVLRGAGFGRPLPSAQAIRHSITTGSAGPSGLTASAFSPPSVPPPPTAVSA